jgi:hypothetical protein
MARRWRWTGHGWCNVPPAGRGGRQLAALGWQRQRQRQRLQSKCTHSRRAPRERGWLAPWHGHGWMTRACFVRSVRVPPYSLGCRGGLGWATSRTSTWDRS